MFSSSLWNRTVLTVLVGRNCFPKPRSILISPGCRKCVSCVQKFIHQLHGQRYILLPITLHINAESRAETLVTYSLLWWEDLGIKNIVWAQPICFDYGRDLPYILANKVQGPNSFLGSITSLNYACNGRLARVTQLEYRAEFGHFWAINKLASLIREKKHYHWSSMPYCDPVKKVMLNPGREPFLDGLLAFFKLQRLYFSFLVKPRQ